MTFNAVYGLSLFHAHQTGKPHYSYLSHDTLLSFSVQSFLYGQNVTAWHQLLREAAAHSFTDQIRYYNLARGYSILLLDLEDQMDLHWFPLLVMCERTDLWGFHSGPHKFQTLVIYRTFSQRFLFSGQNKSRSLKSLCQRKVIILHVKHHLNP